MVDFRKMRFSVECPNCGGKMSTTVFDTAMENSLSCHKCATTLKVRDEGGSLRNVLTNLDISRQDAEASVLEYLRSRD